MKILTNVILIMIAIKTHVVEILMERILVNANQVRTLEPLGTIEADKRATPRAVLTLVTVYRQCNTLKRPISILRFERTKIMFWVLRCHRCQ